jgi:hypothetical protein
MSHFDKFGAVDMIPFKLKNIEPFLVGRHDPRFNPVKQRKLYEAHWTDETRKAVEGTWQLDGYEKSTGLIGGYRYMPGNLYFYVNYLTIQKEAGDENKTRLPDGPPDLRDVEWFIFYDLMVCDGFSGFTNDPFFTSFLPIMKMEKGIPLTEYEKMRVEKFKDRLVDKFGRYKKYIDPREMLYQVFTEPMGRPMYMNESQNYLLLSTRRLGKSYSIIGGISVYNFTFNGARTFEQFVDGSTVNTTVVGSGNSQKTKEYYSKFSIMYENLRTGAGSYKKDGLNWNGVFYAPYSGTIKKENEFIINMVNIEGGGGLEGVGSKAVHVSYARDPSKGAGYAANDNVCEEVGLTANVRDVHRENSPAQESDSKFGKSVYIGTGGDMEKAEGVKKMFYDPHSYKILPCKNIFSGTYKDIGRFIPMTYYKDYRDEFGNQDVRRAHLDAMQERKIMEKGDSKIYLGHKASYPLIPEEIFMKTGGNIFPAKQLEDRLVYLEQVGVPYSAGRMQYVDKMNTIVEFIPDLDGEPFFKMQDLEKAENKEGLIVMYEPPVPHRPEPDFFAPLYIVFYDTVKNDEGTSYCYAAVHKLYDFQNQGGIQDDTVCEWFGRFDKSEKNHDRVFQMAYYYGAKIFAEINNDDIKPYARLRNKYYMLQPKIEDLDGLEVETKKKYDIGFFVMKGMIPSLEAALNERLRTVIDKEEAIVDGEYKVKEIWVVDRMVSLAQVDQLINYHRDANFDVVSELFLQALWLKKQEKIEPQYVDKESDRKLLAAVKEMARYQSGASRRRNKTRKPKPRP